MHLDQLKLNITVRGAIFPEPVQVMVVVPMGESVKLIGKGLTSGKVHEPSLNAEQLASLASTPEKEPFDGDPHKFRLGIEALRFNTAIFQMMVFTNEMTTAEQRSRALLEPFVLILAPFAPHLVEELWEVLGLPAKRFSVTLANF